MNYNNPAERLYKILEKVKGMVATLSHREVWSNIFNLKKTDTSEILFCIGDLLNLIRQTKESILFSDIDENDRDLYLEPINRISKGFHTVNLDGQIHGLQSILDKTTMTSLQFCIIMLKQKNDVISINDEELKILQMEIESLSSKVVDSSLPPELKSFLVEKLESLRKSLVNIRIGGLETVRKVVEESLGAAVLNQQVISQNNEDPNVKGFFGVLGRIHQIVAVTKDSKELFSPIVKLFLE